MKNISGISQILVTAQIIGLALIFWPSDEFRFPALALTALGIAMGLWVIRHNRVGNFSIYPEPLETAKLITDGPYTYIRHPMYTSLFLIVAGIAWANGSYPSYAGFLLVTLVIFFKMPREEMFLMTVFPEYQSYMAQTKRILPGIW